MTKAGPVVAERLKSFIERIESLETERKAILSDIKDVFSEAKGVGYDVQTMRKVLRLRAMDAADRAEQEALLQVYLHALGMVDRIDSRIAAGESQRAIAKAEGVSKTTVQRRGPKPALSPESVENGPPHDTETGEINEIHRGAMQPEGCAKVVRAEPSMSGSAVASGDAVRDASAMPLDVVAAPYREGREHAGSAATAPPACSSAPVDSRTFDEIAGPIPTKLRRERVTA